MKKCSEREAGKRSDRKMGLFKSKVMPKGSAIFTAEDLQKIGDIVGFNAENRKYLKIKYSPSPGWSSRQFS